MNVYLDILFPKVKNSILSIAKQEGGAIHGSRIRDIMMECYPNCGASLDRADSILREMVESDLIEYAEKPTPTLSQAAFLGLSHRKHPGWVAGTREHYSYRLKNNT